MMDEYSQEARLMLLEYYENVSGLMEQGEPIHWTAVARLMDRFAAAAVEKERARIIQAVAGAAQFDVLTAWDIVGIVRSDGQAPEGGEQ